MKRNEFVTRLVSLMLAACVGTGVNAASVLIGDKDGFGGIATGGTGASFNPNLLAGLPALAADGSYTNATDFTLTPLYQNTSLLYDFAYDLSGVASVTSASVTLRFGSLGRRADENDGPGFGVADVTAGLGTASTLLTDTLLSVTTGDVGSAAEESVRDITFDVTSFFAASGGSSGVFQLSVSEPSLHVDLFSVDFAELTFVTAPVPLPAGGALLIGGLLGLGVVRRRR